MFNDVNLKTVNSLITFAGDNPVFQKDDTIPDLQAKGVTALCKILHNVKYAYLADEVGMGKTYQALGVAAMLLKEKKNARILIIAPNEAVQNNWKNEIDNFFARNIIQDDTFLDSSKDVQVTHPIEIVKGHVLENKDARIAVVRLTAFSNMAEKVARMGRVGYSRNGDKMTVRQLYSGISEITGEEFHPAAWEWYSYHDAGKICGSVFRGFSPTYDLIIVDEAQNIRNENNATAFFNYWLGLKKFKNKMVTSADFDLDRREKENTRKKTGKYLLLSATPAHRGVDSLRKQLVYFEDEKNIPDITHEYLEQFMIRRLRTYGGNSKYSIRNVHADDVSVDMSVEQRLFLALIQSKLARIKAKNNSTFKIGFLETFESYDASGDKGVEDDETGEKDKEFENGGSAEKEEKGHAADKEMLKYLAKSYGKAFKGEKCPPHPKLNYMQNEIASILTNNMEHGIAEESEKAIIFVRRLATVDELVKNRLNRMYENSIICHWGERFAIKDAKLIDIQRGFQDIYKKNVSEEDDEEDVTEEIDDEDEGNGFKSPLISWMSVKKSDKAEAFNSVSLFKKSMMINKPNAFLFEENYYRTLHSKDSEGRFKRRIKELVSEGFIKEVCDYIQADKARYIVQRGNGRRINNSYLSVLCYYVAFLHENNELACEFRDFYKIKDKIESREQFIDGKRICRALAQTSIWNLLGNQNGKSGALLDAWLTKDLFNKREALKKWAEKYLKSSEAVLELLYLYCTQKERKNNKEELCRNICKALYSKNSLHGMRIRRLFDVNSANLVCNQLLGVNKIDYMYDPKFMNNQQWVMPATGGNKGNEQLIKRFNTPFYPDIIVCTDVLKEGINLHLFCSKVYHYGLAWTPGDLEQRIGRVDRFFSKTHRAIMEHKDAHIDVTYPYMGKSVDEQQLRKVLQFKLSADPLLDSVGTSRKDIVFNLTDSGTVEELARFTPSENEQTNFPYSGEIFWNEEEVRS